MPQFAKGVVPSDGMWIEIDLRTGLKKALEIYADDLLAYEKVYRVTTLNVTGMNIRKKVDLTIRILVRKPIKKVS